MAALSAAATTEPGLWTTVGHRGVTDSSLATENTLRAFRLARDGGATAIEFDVQVTLDGEVIVMHDDGLARTTTCAGKVSDRTWTDIRTHCRGNVAHEPIPSLDQALTWVRRNELGALLELKPPVGKFTDEVLSGIIARIHAAGLAERVLAFSRSLSLLQRVEALDFTIRTQYIAASYRDGQRSLRFVDGLNVCAELLHQHPGLARRLVARDKLVVGRVTDSAEDWAVLAAQHAHGTLTNDPARWTRWHDGSAGHPSSRVPDGACKGRPMAGRV